MLGWGGRSCPPPLRSKLHHRDTEKPQDFLRGSVSPWLCVSVSLCLCGELSRLCPSIAFLFLFGPSGQTMILDARIQPQRRRTRASAAHLNSFARRSLLE